jgi:hypothetical protein
MGAGRVIGDGACAESGGNVDVIVKRDRVCTFGGGPGGARGTGGQEDDSTLGGIIFPFPGIGYRV